MAERITKQEIEVRVTEVNKYLERCGKDWRVNYQDRNGYSAVDAVYANNPRLAIRMLKSGTRREVYIYLCGMVAVTD
jgi:hypothetical protein